MQTAVEASLKYKAPSAILTSDSLAKQNNPERGTVIAHRHVYIHVDRDAHGYVYRHVHFHE